MRLVEKNQLNNIDQRESGWIAQQSEAEILKSLKNLKNQKNSLWRLHKLSYDLSDKVVLIEIKVKRSELRKLKKHSSTVKSRVRDYLVDEVLQYIRPNILAQHLHCKIELANIFYREEIFDGELHNSVFIKRT